MLALPPIAAVVAALFLPHNLFVAGFAAGVGFVAAAVVGVPLLYWAVSRGWTRPHQLALLGAAGGALPAVLIAASQLLVLTARHRIAPQAAVEEEFALASLPALIGVASALTYWLIFFGRAAQNRAIAATVVGLAATFALPYVAYGRRAQWIPPIYRPHYSYSGDSPMPREHTFDGRFQWSLVAGDLIRLDALDRAGCTIEIRSKELSERLLTDLNPLNVSILIREEPSGTARPRITRMGWSVDPRFFVTTAFRGCEPW